MSTSIDIRQQIQKRMAEIDTYLTQSLFREARIRCKELAAFIRENDSIVNKRALRIQLSRKLKDIDAGCQAFDTFSATVEMSPQQQKVVSRLFTAGKGGSTSAAFEAATALLVFGQRALAMKAFGALLDDEKHRVAAAKSIIRCHLGSGHIKRAVNQYLIWLEETRLPAEHLEAIRTFLQAVLIKKGLKNQLPGPARVEETHIDEMPQKTRGDFLSVVLPYADKRSEKKQILIEVNFQRGNMINCIIAKHYAEGISSFRSGTVLPHVQVNSTNMISFCSLRLAEIRNIKVGRLKGDTTITMEVLEDTASVT